MARARPLAADLVKLLDDSRVPVYVVDQDQRIAYCNEACAQWVGVDAVELMGRRCTYHSPDEPVGPDAAAAGLCPPPQVFSGHPQQALVSGTSRDGRAVYRRAGFWPLGDGQDDSAAVMAVLEINDCPQDALTADAASDLRLHDEVRRFRRQMVGTFRPETLIGNSPAIVRVRAQIDLATASDANVTIVGPDGAGKEHAAKAIHYRATPPGTFVPLACAVLETNLMRSTLRALGSRNPSARSARGTLLLDDADSLPAEVQGDLIELLRGGTLRMRVIALSVRPLAEVVAQGTFSRELACLLSTIAIELPPLAERMEDLPLLAQAFVETINAQRTKQLGGLSRDALDRLAAYGWPGNVDELAAVVLESHERAGGGEIGVKDLAPQIHLAASAERHPRRVDETIVLEDFLARVERELIVRAIRRARGNKSKAAKLLGLSRPRLYRRLVQLGLAQPDEDEGQE
jgi:DNA-binding NtrC family response regulator